MGFWIDVVKDAWRENVETIKATAWEATVDNPIGGLGPIIGMAYHTASLIHEWEEVTVPRSFLGVGRGREIGMIKANRPDIKVVGISDEGFYVEKGQKAEAVAYLNGVNLRAW